MCENTFMYITHTGIYSWDQQEKFLAEERHEPLIGFKLMADRQPVITSQAFPHLLNCLTNKEVSCVLYYLLVGVGKFQLQS